MARLRYNNSDGVLGASLTSSAPTLTFAVAPSWATIVPPDYIPLILDPATSLPDASEEIVWVTAYTSGATTATILRGQEGTSGVSHANTAAWSHGPTVQDFTWRAATTLVFASTITPVLPVQGDAAINIGALTGSPTLANPSGNPVDGQIIRFRFQQDGTGGRTITFGTAYGFGTDYPASLVPTTANALWEMTFEWVAAQSLWWCTGIARGFTGKALPALSQSITAAPSTSSYTLAYTTTPTQGHGLVVFFAGQSAMTLSSYPTGWTPQWSSAVADSSVLICLTKTAGASESNSYLFTFTGTGPSSMVALDISGANTKDQAATASGLSTPSGTGTTQPVMLLVAMTQNDGSNGSHMPSFTDGTLTQISATVQFHPCVVGYKDLSSLTIPAEAGNNPEGTGSRPMGYVTLM